MANILTNRALSLLGAAGIDWVANDIRETLYINAQGAVSATTQFESELAAGGEVNREALGSKTLAGTNPSTWNAADTVHDLVSGSAFDRLVHHIETGNPATGSVLTVLDTHSGGAINVTPNGENINVRYSSGQVVSISSS